MNKTAWHGFLIGLATAFPTLTRTPRTTLAGRPSFFQGEDIGILLGGIILIVVLIVILVISAAAFSRRGRTKRAAPAQKKSRASTKVVGLPPPPETTAPCPNCKTLNRTSAKFCKTCGRALTLAAPGAARQPAATRPLAGVTTPLGAEAESLPLAALALGTRIGSDRYQITEVIHTSKQINRYRVESSQPQVYCPKCNSASPEGSQFCQGCGNPLENVPAYAPRYRIKEVANPERFHTEYELAQLGLAHPSLIPPRETFVEIHNGQPRYYVVLDDITWSTAAQVAAPQELLIVLGWGAGLAEGLSYLHQNRIALGRLTGAEIALPGRTAQWADFENARIITAEEWQQNGTRLMADQVRQLAELLYRLATGLIQFDPDSRELMPKAAAAFAKALGESGYLTAEELAIALRDAESSLRRPGGIDLHAARSSDVGQERDLDEDSVLALELGQIYRSVSTPLGVYAVADGMGGHEGGDVASRLVIRTIARRAINDILLPALTDNAAPPDYEKWIKESVREANQAVLAQRKASRTNMGTTLVMAVIDNTTAYIAHIGDSRAYLIREGSIKLLTTDHSLVERLVAARQITRAEAAAHPQKNIIYKNIGDKPQVEPDIGRQTLLPGDTLLLCCDGLSGEVGDDRLLRIVQQSPSLPAACQQLVRAANEAGGHDNISVILIGVMAIA
jgi:serine/threonine protein phosphatase PrpC